MPQAWLHFAEALVAENSMPRIGTSERSPTKVLKSERARTKRMFGKSALKKEAIKSILMKL